MSNVIRKISVGVDVNNKMHYIKGKTCMNNYIIDDIVRCHDNSFDIWIRKGNEVYLWKKLLPTLPILIEYNLDF